MPAPRYHILPSMQAPEVVRCALHDKPALERKMQRPMEQLRRRHLKGDRSAVLEQVERYTAPSGNHWIVVMRYQKSGIQVIQFVWYRGMDNRIRAMRIRWDGLTQVHFSWHVLEQYAARFSPDVAAEERLLQFVSNNYDVAFRSQRIIEDDDDDDDLNTYGGIRQGLLTGVYDPEEDIVYTTTFVDHGHFFADQVKMMEQMDFERFMGSLTPGQRKALLEKREAREGGSP